jgi:enterochelin esterase-like enzyme
MPDTNAVVVVGSSPALGAWEHAGALVLRQGQSGIWEGSVSFPKDSLLAFKITRGAWRREALDAEGIIPPDTWLMVRGDTALTYTVPQWKDELAWAAGGVVGDTIQHLGFPSRIMGVRRDLWVLLPESYDEKPHKRYPVLYVQDGGNAFDPASSYAGIDWRIDETVDTLSAQGRIPEILVVAIDRSPRRMFEYADTTLGALYAQFVIEELKPFIDGEYRTKANPDHTAVIGSGMGGLMSFLLAWWYPDVFGQAACLSPLFLWGDGRVLDRVEDSQPPPHRSRLYLTVGTEGLENQLKPGMLRMCALLDERGWQDGVDLACGIVEGAGHKDRDWAERMLEALTFLFPMRQD